MKKGSTLFLKLVIIMLGLAVLAIAAVVVPYNIANEGIGPLFPFWIIMYLTTIPFYIALFQGWKLLSFIDKNIAFSAGSVRALGYIKYCAFAMSLLYLSAIWYVFQAAQMEDAPGMILMWLGVSGAPMVIAVFAALLQMLLQNIIDIKSENDLTV